MQANLVPSPRGILIFLFDATRSQLSLTLRIGKRIAHNGWFSINVQLCLPGSAARLGKTCGFASLPVETEILGEFRYVESPILTSFGLYVIWVTWALLRTDGESLVGRQISKRQVLQFAVVFDSMGIGREPLAKLLPDYQSPAVRQLEPW